MFRIQSFLIIGLGIIIALLVGIIIGTHRPAQRVTIFNNAATAARPGPEKISGFYEYEFAGIVMGVDLHENGTGTMYQRQKFETAQYGQQTVFWKMKDGAILVNNTPRWKIDGDDLVDGRQNRWVRLRY